jgi:hypothetical protein
MTKADEDAIREIELRFNNAWGQPVNAWRFIWWIAVPNSSARAELAFDFVHKRI